jgi:hypothetical protein
MLTAMELFGLISGGVGVAGFFTGLYFGFHPRNVSGRLSYKVLDANTSMDWFSQRQPSTSSVYIDIWNDSQLALPRDGVLEPLKIRFPDCASVTEAKVVQVRAASTDAIRVAGVGTGTLTVRWDYLALNTAFRVKVSASSILLKDRNKPEFSGSFVGFLLAHPRSLDAYNETLPSVLVTAAGFCFAVWCAFNVLFSLLSREALRWAPTHVPLAALMATVAWALVGIFAFVAINLMHSVGSWLLNTNSPFEGPRRFRLG